MGGWSLCVATGSRRGADIAQALPPSSPTYYGMAPIQCPVPLTVSPLHSHLAPETAFLSHPQLQTTTRGGIKIALNGRVLFQGSSVYFAALQLASVACFFSFYLLLYNKADGPNMAAAAGRKQQPRGRRAAPAGST